MDLERKYQQRIRQDLEEEGPPQTSQYKSFKQQYMPKRLTVYEKACNVCAKILPVSPSPKDRPALQEAISVCHMETSPEGVLSFAILIPLLCILIIVGLGYGLPILLASMHGSTDPAAAGDLFILLFAIVAGGVMILPLQRLPFYFATTWRMQASNQMVLCVFYVVTYMRHTSNLELAIDFAGDHLAPPLSLDMKKIIWDIETEKYDSVKESLDAYLLTWREWNPEFVESMHLIEGSLLETSETRRIEMLDKSLSVMLEETYEKMLHYAHELRSPLTTLHMLGVILPILGLVILPLMVSFMQGVKWYHVAIVYNVTLPLMVYLIAKKILSTRPTGYGTADITDLNPELKKYKDIVIPLGGRDELRISPSVFAFVIGAAVLLLAAFPLAYHIANPDSDWVYDTGLHQVSISHPEESAKASYRLLDYRLRDVTKPYDEVDNPYDNGPYGIGAVLLSLLIPLSIGIALGMYFTLRSRHVIKIREATHKLEAEFASAMFQLGNRLSDGLPAEIAFAKVAEVLDGTPTGVFFTIVTSNIRTFGMSVEEAIFDPQRGAILSFPSSVIESSMKVLVESSKKGPLIASNALINVSEYIKQMHRVDERLKDLLSEVISSMKSQITFLTPIIAGIVVGITAMISNILGTIMSKLATFGSTVGSQAGNLATIFGGGGIPTYHFQAIVGLYVVQITIILTVMVNGVENGADETAKQDMLGRNLIRSTILYVVISMTTIIIFGGIAGRLVNLG